MLYCDLNFIVISKALCTSTNKRKQLLTLKLLLQRDLEKKIVEKSHYDKTIQKKLYCIAYYGFLCLHNYKTPATRREMQQNQ